MSDIAVVKSEMTEVSEKPVPEKEEIKFPPFPDPKEEDFDEDIPEEERNHYKTLYKDLNTVTVMKLHCSACDRHLGCSARNDNRMRTHPMLRTLVCQTCHTFYNSGEFEKGDDGSELYCRWCGQGGQVYCCSACPHVFCAKCIKRNLGTPKIKEIEQLDDWKCFKCNNRCLWDLRALCWAVIRYCDLKNKITYEVEDPTIKEACQRSCAQDYSECCKYKVKRKEKLENKKKEGEQSTRKSTTSVYKLPPTIQVKKFASINMEEPIKTEKKAQKRAVSPKNKIAIKNPISLNNKLIGQLNMPSTPKKVRMSNSPVINPVRFNNDRKLTPNFACYARIRPKGPQMPAMFNGFNTPTTFTNDNINLSLENLTQGLDMSAMVALAGPSQDDDVVCTPDFPLEPLCEVTEDNGDDDVQCITPGPVVAPKPAPVVRPAVLPDLNPENIIQMTDNDVTVNSTTGGLKFRVDPQTLSSNKMYRLPDGRIFAINANPNMPGGYSATIVAVTDSNLSKVPPKGTTFAAKLSAVPLTSTPPPLKYGNRHQPSRNAKRSTPKSSKVNKSTEKPSRVCDLNVPVEWYRYNLVDAIDALEYSLSRLHQLKKDATTVHLRTRSMNEMRLLHRSLERCMATSMTRFKEIRDNLNKEYKQYISKKNAASNVNNSDDDDVEILQEDDNDDPIYIDENSLESNHNDNQDIDLTVVGSSDFNDSSDKSLDKNDLSKDPLSMDRAPSPKDKNNESNRRRNKENGAGDCENVEDVLQNDSKSKEDDKNILSEKEDNQEERQNDDDSKCKMSRTDMNGQLKKSINALESKKIAKLDEENILNDNSDSEKKPIDAEMSQEMIEDLLKDDNVSNGDDDSETVDNTAVKEDDVSKNDDAARNEDDDEAAGIVDEVTGNGDKTAQNGNDTVHSLDISDEIQDEKSEKD
ncbi:uncharacterized protein LOC120623747 [Pararge aegeria]|uniref:uncharacterized protein LOC120623747 n=1 Tax=Pararge aegeria TaxID=116150 RepID=UPI0019CF6664|nr:uncharacterized protein LOC120623747 [Pararge aegeria]